MTSKLETRTITVMVSKALANTIKEEKAKYGLSDAKLMAIVLPDYLEQVEAILAIETVCADISFLRDHNEFYWGLFNRRYTVKVSLAPEIWAKFDAMKIRFNFEFEDHGWNMLLDMKIYYAYTPAYARANPSSDIAALKRFYSKQ